MEHKDPEPASSWGQVSRFIEILTDSVYDDLRALALRYLRKERRGKSLRPTELVHEAYLRLVAGRSLKIHDPNHLVAVAAITMRHILVERARSRGAIKRGGGYRVVTLRDDEQPQSDSAVDLLELESCLQRLEKDDPRAARIVTLHFFGGMTYAEIGAILGISERYVGKIWSLARACLLKDLEHR